MDAARLAWRQGEYPWESRILSAFFQTTYSYKYGQNKQILLFTYNILTICINNRYVYKLFLRQLMPADKRAKYRSISRYVLHLVEFF